jgi:hypothetical protein
MQYIAGIKDYYVTIVDRSKALYESYRARDHHTIKVFEMLRFIHIKQGPLWAVARVAGVVTLHECNRRCNLI